MLAQGPFEGVTAMLGRNARERADEIALTVGARSLSWRQLDLLSNRIANRLRTLDLRNGARVAICARNSLEYLPTLLGIVKAGLSVVPLPIMVGTDALTAMLADSQARLLFADEALVETAQAARAQLPADRQPTGVSFESTRTNWPALATWLADVPDNAPDHVPSADNEFNIVYSSGTTGRPKGIIHSHGFRAGDASELRTLGFEPGGRTIITTALYSNWSLYAFLATLQSGARTVVMEKFDVDNFLTLCEDLHPNNVFLVPVQCQRILDDASLDRRHLGERTLKWVAGSPLSPAQKQALLTRWPGGLNEIYGMSEGAPSTMLQAHLFPDKLDSVGRPGPHMQIRILDEAGQAQPPGVIGEIAGHGPAMMRGYNNSPEATATLHWHDATGALFFRSGDLGYLDNDGFLHIAGRVKDMIISGGFNIYPADIEAVLAGHPQVAESAVIAAPCRRWGESPLAVVVLSGTVEISPEQLRHWANQRLGKVQRLARVVFCDGLPRNSLGKVLKTELREHYAQQSLDWNQLNNS